MRLDALIGRIFVILVQPVGQGLAFRQRRKQRPCVVDGAGRPDTSSSVWAASIFSTISFRLVPARMCPCQRMIIGMRIDSSYFCRLS